MNEEERAALWRANASARVQAQEARRRALAGNNSAREAVDAAWLPFYLGQLESNSPEEILFPPEPLPPQL